MEPFSQMLAPSPSLGPQTEGFYSATYPHLGRDTQALDGIAQLKPAAQTSNNLFDIVNNAERRFEKTFERLPNLGSTTNSKVSQLGFSLCALSFRRCSLAQENSKRRCSRSRRT